MNLNRTILRAVLFLMTMAAFQAFCISPGGFAGGSHVISWTSPRSLNPGDPSAAMVLDFHGALRSGNGLLPVFMADFPLASQDDSVAGVTVLNPVFEDIPAGDLSRIAGLEAVTEVLQPETGLSVTRKKASATVSFVPLRRNPETGRVERLVSFDLGLVLTKSHAGNRLKSGNAYASHSVLSSGTWYKYAVAADGIYRITYDDLARQGIPVSSINPQNIRIYGNGGGMLPEANSTARVDDLLENPVFVYGEEDGRFDAGDYILFFGQGPDRWVYSPSENFFHCRKNSYSDRAFYFLNFDLGPGKRIPNEPSTQKETTYVAERFEDYAIYNSDDVNLIKTGREWWDKQYFDVTTSRNYSFSFPNIDTQSQAAIYAYVAARSTTGNTAFTVSVGGSPVMTLPVERVSEGYDNVFANVRAGKAAFTPAGPDIQVTLNYQKSSSSSVGYLNYIEVNAIRALTLFGSQMSFRSLAGTAANGVTEFRLNGNGQAPEVWDVTDPGNIRRMVTTVAGNYRVFRTETASLREFRAFDGAVYGTPEWQGAVPNQDLHGAAVPGYIMVVHPDFLTEAERLATFHRSVTGLSVLIVTPGQVYNEFSSGAQDITAIRDFVRMMYDRAEPGQEPGYLLLFGDASYDYKNHTQANTNFVPSFQSVESLSPISSFVSDDYFGLLDPGEGQGAKGTLDIGIGRFPVDTPEQARASVDKVMHYCSQSDSVKNDWRNVVTFIGDDQNEGGNLFVEDSEDLSAVMENKYRSFNVDKIYSDAYDMISTPGGARYPEVNDAINKRVEKGCLIMNYVGHGGEVGWAHERILEVPDIQGWTNLDRMPVFVTATCEFSRFDDPGRVSAGEWVFLNPKGGGVALFTTTRLTFAGTNKSLLVNFYNKAFEKVDGNYRKLGDLLMASKNGMGSSPNIHAFVLLGDPAMQMAYPSLGVVTTTVNGRPHSALPDTLKALSEVTITGEVRDASGQKATGFSGTVFPTVFDKETESWTKANSGEYPAVKFYLMKNPVYKGQVEVVNGEFSFTFIVPKDIAYQYGPGKISYYARSPQEDANGFDDGIQVGGYNNEAPSDDTGPTVTLFLNDRNFRSGGITNQSPILLADISDSSGVNTVGNGIGHDITAVLDGRSTSPMILNDYYVSDLNTYKSGEISYPVGTLSDGLHTISVKAWDVHNNSGEAEIEFLVVSSAGYALQHLLNYPNPMRDHTTFSWETNQVNQELEAEIDIYTISGQPVKKLTLDYYGQGYRQASVTWDGRQDNGMMVGSGLYIWTLRLKVPDGTVKTESSRLVVIR